MVEITREQLDMLITLVQAFNSLSVVTQKQLTEGYDIDIDAEVTHELEDDLRNLY